MVITLRPETEAALQQKAAMLGMPVDALAIGILEREVNTSIAATKSREDIDVFFRQLRQLSSKVVAVPDPNFTRETIYQDHD